MRVLAYLGTATIAVVALVASVYTAYRYAAAAGVEPPLPMLVPFIIDPLAIVGAALALRGASIDAAHVRRHGVVLAVTAAAAALAINVAGAWGNWPSVLIHAGFPLAAVGAGHSLLTLADAERKRAETAAARETARAERAARARESGSETRRESARVTRRTVERERETVETVDRETLASVVREDARPVVAGLLDAGVDISDGQVPKAVAAELGVSVQTARKLVAPARALAGG